MKGKPIASGLGATKHKISMLSFLSIVIFHTAKGYNNIDILIDFMNGIVNNKVLHLL